MRLRKALSFLALALVATPRCVCPERGELTRRLDEPVGPRRHAPESAPVAATVWVCAGSLPPWYDRQSSRSQ